MWMKVDDGLPTHRKTRAVLKSDAEKSRDAAPLGLWALAGAWAGKNRTDGWVPEDELDRWDDNWQPLADRLVRAGFWWPHVRDGENGYGFNNWHDYNDPADAASKAGSFGNHVRWHVNEKRVDPECHHCPKKPDEEPEPPEMVGSIGGRSGGESHPESGGESHFRSGAIALPEPEPDPNPTRNPEQPFRDESRDGDSRFDEFWDTYGKKVDRKKAEAKWRLALKRVGVTPDLLIDAAREYVTYERTHNEGGRYVMDPARWLNGHRWEDERPTRPPQSHQGRAQGWLQLAADLGEQQPTHNVREIGNGR